MRRNRKVAIIREPRRSHLAGGPSNIKIKKLSINYRELHRREPPGIFRQLGVRAILALTARLQFRRRSNVKTGGGRPDRERALRPRVPPAACPLRQAYKSANCLSQGGFPG